MVKNLVSVIVTCYNQENFIIRTLESVSKQSYTHWECIVVDDESSDQSHKIIKEYIAKNEKFKLIRHKNKGLARSRNEGFKQANGEYINFLDGDDTFLPDKLKKQVEAFGKNKKAKICICDHQFYYENKKTFTYYQFDKIKPKPLEQLIYNWNNGMSFPPMAPMYKREIWSEHEVPFQEDYKHWCEDWVFNVLLALKGYEYVILEDVLCNYHMHSTNFTSDKKRLITAAIHAAIYLHPKLPEKYQSGFIEKTVDNLLELYIKDETPKILMSSKNWRVANALSKPFLDLIKKINS